VEAFTHVMDNTTFDAVLTAEGGLC